jgi:hypothetical protein
LPFSASLSKAAPKAKDLLAQHQKTFDELDFDVYSNQMWDRLQESHADDILVTYPDGHQSKGRCGARGAAHPDCLPGTA